MTNGQRNGETPDPLRAHQETNLIQPPFRLSEALIEDITRLARSEGLTGQLASNLLRPAVTARSIEVQARERLKGLTQWEVPEGPLPIDHA